MSEITNSQKAKLLHLKDILTERTDEAHPLTAAELSAALDARGVKASRQTIYGDIEALKHYGLDILQVHGKESGYYLASRHFELHELKLLVDAVQSSRFITAKKSEELIGKLAKMTSATQAKQLNRQVYVEGLAKPMNESVYYNVDAIHLAVDEDRRLAFKYFDYNVKKCRAYRKGGAYYSVTPIALYWADDKYYLIAYNADNDGVRHYCVDRMSDAVVLDEPANDFDKKSFDVPKYVKSLFGMYHGEVVRARLSFDKSLINNILDHFGRDVCLIDAGDKTVEVHADVAVSPVFLSWVIQFGEKARILGPDSLIAAMTTLLDAQNRMYSQILTH